MYRGIWEYVEGIWGYIEGSCFLRGAAFLVVGVSWDGAVTVVPRRTNPPKRCITPQLNY